MPYHHIYSTLLQLLSFPSTSFSGHSLSSHSTIHRPLHQWDPTYKLATFRQPLYKLNFDGALFDSEQCAGWGVLIRNEAGQVVASLSERALLPFTAIEVEAMAARRALVLALEAGFDRVILEGDSLVLINALQNNSLCNPLRPHSKRHTVSCLFFRSTLFPFT